MKISLKIYLTYLLIALIPILIIGTFVLSRLKADIEKERIIEFERIADLQLKAIELFFKNLQVDLTVTKSFWDIQVNLPKINNFQNDRNNPIYITAVNTLDSQLKSFTKEHALGDFLLFDPNGKIVYSINSRNKETKLGNYLPVFPIKELSKARDKIWVSDVFEFENSNGILMVESVINNTENNLLGFIAFIVDISEINQFIQNNTGFGNTGETIIAMHQGNEIVFITSLLHKKVKGSLFKIPINSVIAIPMQNALRGKNGSGISVDYRNESVIAVWRYISSLHLGLVAKIDTKEAFSSIHQIREYVIIAAFVLLILAFIIAFFMTRIITKPIINLEKGIEFINSGRSDYKLATDKKDEIGQLSRVFGSMTESLQKNNSLLNSIINSSLDLIFVKDKNLRLILCNSAYAKAVGKHPEELYGKTDIENGWDTELVMGNSLKGVRGYEADDLDALSGKIIYNQCYPINVEGVIRVFDTIKLQLKSSNGIIFGVLGIARDVTDRRKAEELKQAIKVKSDFISMVTHELRSPLGAVEMGLTFLFSESTDNLNEKQLEVLNLSKRSINRLMKLINSILDLEKLNSSTISLDIQETNINNLVQEVKSSMLYWAKEKNICINVNMDNSLPLANLDRDKIIQVLVNLVSNAIKFTDKGSIIISTLLNKNEIVVSVKDEGIGIEEKDIPSLFMPFKQLGNAQNYKEKSSGLGLSISKTIIEAHGGKIWAESKIGEGTVFYFSLPLKKDIS